MKVQTGGKNAVAQRRKVNHEMPFDVGSRVFGALNCKSLSPLSTFLYFIHSFCTFEMQFCVSSATVS